MCRSSIESIQTVIPSHSKDNLNKSNTLPSAQSTPLQDTPVVTTNQLQMSLSQPNNLSSSSPDPPTHPLYASSQHLISSSSQPPPIINHTSTEPTQPLSTPNKPGQLHQTNPKPNPANHSCVSTTSTPHEHFTAEISNWIITAFIKCKGGACIMHAPPSSCTPDVINSTILCSYWN